MAWPTLVTPYGLTRATVSKHVQPIFSEDISKQVESPKLQKKTRFKIVMISVIVHRISFHY